MSNIDKLVASLNQNTEQAKTALSDLLKIKAEFQKQSNPSPEELEQLELEISAVSNLIEQNEKAISSLSKKLQSGGSEEFDIGLKQPDDDSF